MWAVALRELPVCNVSRAVSAHRCLQVRLFANHPQTPICEKSRHDPELLIWQGKRDWARHANGESRAEVIRAQTRRGVRCLRVSSPRSWLRRE